MNARVAQGCSYGGANGGHYRALLPDDAAAFNVSNPKRCALSDLPFCACGNLEQAPLNGFAPPPPIQFADRFYALPAFVEGEATLGGADQAWHPDLGQFSALLKRVASAKSIDLSRRSSHRTVSCPGTDDGSQSCARFCAAEHASTLRAFTVTGSLAVPPPSPPPVAPTTDPPPLPPSAPFSACGNECPLLAAGDDKCRDGGYGSFSPTVCAFSTQCAQCGFREHQLVIVSDDSCATARNGVCEDGAYGSARFRDTIYGLPVAHLCGLGTDAYTLAH